MLWTNTQVSKLFKAFTNGSSANMKLSKSHKILQSLNKSEKSGGFLSRLLGPLLKSRKYT